MIWPTNNITLINMLFYFFVDTLFKSKFAKNWKFKESNMNKTI